MTILKDIEISIEPQMVLSRLSSGPAAGLLSGEMRRAVDMAKNLISPASVFEIIYPVSVKGETVALGKPGGDREIRLKMGPLAYLMKHAEIALVSVSTIGKKLEEKARELNRRREEILSYLLDSAGVVALGQTGMAVRKHAEKEARQRGWGVSPSVGPGSLAGWPLSDQSTLCSLLPLERIGVELIGDGVLSPFKSASGMIGMGPGYTSETVGSVCKYCMHEPTCWRSRKGEEEEREG